MPASDRLGLIAAILSWPRLLPVLRIVLVSAYLIGGIQKPNDFNGVVAAQPHFGLAPAWPWAIAAIVIEIGGLALVIVRRFVWLGAGVFTAIAMLAANGFGRSRPLHRLEGLLRAPELDRWPSACLRGARRNTS